VWRRALKFWWLCAAVGWVLAAGLPVRAGWIFDGRPSTWEGIPEELRVSEQTYPVFRLDLGLVEGNWTDFEIKASTNNFAGLVYYYKSWTTNQNALYRDTKAWTYFTDDESADVRVWNRATNGVSISSMLVSTSSVVQWVYFYPSHECAVDWTTWMSSANSNLVWSFVRVDDIGFELNRSGSKQRWNPVRPDSWEVGRTVP
jgi:hypothetical protein